MSEELSEFLNDAPSLWQSLSPSDEKKTDQGANKTESSALK